MKGILAAALAMLIGGAAVAQVSAAVAARRWAALLDAGSYAESWRSSGILFRSHLSEPQWASAAAAARSPLGALVTRRVTHEQTRRSLPGVPDGDYRIVTFDTRFARKHDAVETITLAREPDGWKVDGYFIR